MGESIACVCTRPYFCRAKPNGTIKWTDLVITTIHLCYRCSPGLSTRAPLLIMRLLLIGHYNSWFWDEKWTWKHPLEHISELNSAIAFLSLENSIALFSSEMCWGVSKYTSQPKTMITVEASCVGPSSQSMAASVISRIMLQASCFASRLSLQHHRSAVGT